MDTLDTLELPDIDNAIQTLKTFITPYVDEVTGELKEGEHPSGVPEARDIIGFVNSIVTYGGRISWPYLQESWLGLSGEINASKGEAPSQAQLDDAQQQLQEIIVGAEQEIEQRV